MMDFDQRYQTYLQAFESALTEAAESIQTTPPVLGESMRYSLQSGGKRIRPVLFYAALDAFGLPYTGERDIAVALECIHTYSLIHDDLPAMDNDDFRRGKPSNHKKFGEGNAILAGDALLSYAFDLLLRQSADALHLRAAQAISRAAGAFGMVSGQSADLYYMGKAAGAEQLDFIAAHKTARLIAAPVVAAAILAGRDEAAAEEYGNYLGLLFQLTDDLLDELGNGNNVGKTLGKDREEDKLTYVKVFGVSASERMADEYAQRAQDALKRLGGDTAFLAELVRFVRRRDR